MKPITNTLLCFFTALLIVFSAKGQDFILIAKPSEIQGLEKLEESFGATDISIIWVPASEHITEVLTNSVWQKIQQAGLEMMTNLPLPANSFSEKDIQAHTRLIKKSQLAGIQYIPRSGWDTVKMTDWLNRLNEKIKLPRILLTSIPSNDDVKKWLNPIQNAISNDLPRPRVLDKNLREVLKQACENTEYDVRQVYQSGLRETSTLTGFNLLTFLNLPQQETTQLVRENTLLAYVYLLSNNQIGLPVIHFNDYITYQEEIDQLLKVHKDYIFNSISLEYLNDQKSRKKSIFLKGEAKRTLVFQIDGTNTPAGKTESVGKRDVLVAINFANTPLHLIQEINGANLDHQTIFTDLLGLSEMPIIPVINREDYQITNSVELKLPPLSYSIWVQGGAPQVVPSFVEFTTAVNEDVIELNWEVPFENTIKGYSIERSVAGKAFEEVAWINALSKREQKATYLYIDQTPDINAIQHYRIKLITLDNQFEYSTVESAKLSQPIVQFRLLDSKNQDLFKVEVLSNYQEQGELAIFDAKGNRVFFEKQVINKGKSLKKIDLSTLPMGIYFLQFSTSSNQQQWTKRLVKH